MNSEIHIFSIMHIQISNVILKLKEKMQSKYLYKLNLFLNNSFKLEEESVG